MARYYKRKRIGANVYIQGKFGKGLREIVDTDNPLLYSDGRYPTKLTAADLPEDYIKIHSRVIWYMKGYLRTSGIVDMMYRWVRENYLFKDDYIYISYHGPLKEVTSHLGVAGYLKPVSDAVETEFGTFMELALPNKEIRRVYNTEILSWLRGTVDGNVMAGLEKALYLNDGKKLQEFLRKYMITCISCFDGAAEGRTRSGGPWLCADRSGTETFYHGMMLGLAAGMSSRYYIRSNRESGEGRFDLVLEPKVHFLPGIIMEFKATKNDAGLSASADEALKQIEDKHYDTDMKDRGIREIVKYGIAFAGKNVEIAIG